MLPLVVSLLLTDPAATKVDVSGGVSAEVRGGRAPPDPRFAPEAAFMTIVTPTIDMMARGRRGGTFNLGYSPRLQLRVPNRLNIKRPLLLHQAYLQYRVDPNRRLAIDVLATGSVGEIDYSSIAVALGLGQGVLPDLEVTNYAVGMTEVRFTTALAARHSLAVYPFASFRSPIGRSRRQYETMDRALPTQTDVGLGVAYAHQATRLDSVGVRVEPRVVQYRSDATFFATDARTLWTRRLALRTELTLEGGVFGARVLRVEGDQSEARSGADRVFPVGALSVQGRLRSRASHWVDGLLVVGADGFFDRLRDRVDPRGRVQVDITTTLPPRWTAGITGSMFAPFTGQPRVLSDGSVPRDEVVFRAQTPVGYLINNYTRFEFGTVVSARSSHFAADDFGFSRLETWLYVAIRVGGSTARGGDEFGGAASGPIGVGTTGLGAYSGGR